MELTSIIGDTNQKKPTWASIQGCPITSAYSSTGLPARPGCPSSSRPTRNQFTLLTGSRSSTIIGGHSDIEQVNSGIMSRIPRRAELPGQVGQGRPIWLAARSNRTGRDARFRLTHYRAVAQSELGACPAQLEPLTKCRVSRVAAKTAHSYSSCPDKRPGCRKSGGRGRPRMAARMSPRNLAGAIPCQVPPRPPSTLDNSSHRSV
jgi:hypothetical protein